MEALTEERRIGSGFWKELRGMLLFSSLTHFFILGLLGLFFYHYNWVRQQRNGNKYSIYSVNLVNFSGPPLTSQPKFVPKLSGLKEGRRKSTLPIFLKPIFKAAGPREAKNLATIPEEPVKLQAINKRVAYPTILEPAKGKKPRKAIFSGPLLNPPSPKKAITRRAITGLKPAKEQPILPTLTSTSSTLPTRTGSMEEIIRVMNKTHLNIPESLHVPSYQTKAMNKERVQQLADLLMPEAFGPVQISHPTIPIAPELSSFSQGKGAMGALFKKGGFTPLNTQDPNLIPYISQVKERVLGFWRYPMEVKPGLSGAVQLVFTVERDGSVSRIELLKSSGYPLLDNGAMQALSRASPFSPLPQKIKVTNLSIAGTFKYNME